MEESHRKLCPFSGQECLEDKCSLWAELSISKPGSLVPQKEGMCIFKALLLVSNSPKMMMAPQQPMNLNLKNLIQ